MALNDVLKKKLSSIATTIKSNPDVSKVDFTADGKAILTMKNGEKLDGTKYVAAITNSQTIAPNVKKSPVKDVVQTIGQNLGLNDITLNDLKNLVTKDPTNVSLLPKTKASKDAERVISQSGANGALQAGTPISFSNPIIITILLGLFLIAAYFLRK